ncbi:CAP domain-containing protein [Pseudoroseicyclus sp. CXY001]|uniref:CAP domain-containing protein n=1 Tax=Pseudoroseicyclus sp. CXY001 TaxID=3242492 RepID=UPI0035717921
MSYRCLAAAALALLAACEMPAAPATAPTAPAAPVVEAATPASDRPIQDARRAAGLGPVTRNAALERAAEVQLRHILATGDLTHAGPGGSRFTDRARAAGFCQGGRMGENLASGHPTLSAAVAGWLASPGHRTNLLRPEADAYGLASSGEVYVLVIGKSC